MENPNDDLMAGDVEPRDGPHDRPPDMVVQIGLPTALERPSPPVLDEDRRDPKKARGVLGYDSDQSRSVTSPEKTTYASMMKKGSIGVGSEPFDEDLSPDKGLSKVGDRPVEEQTVRGQQEPGSKELYGPWMIATNRCRRPTTGSGSGRVAAETPRVASGSRFTVLQEDSPFNVMEVETEGVNPTLVDPNAEDVESAGTSKGTKKVIYRESNAK
ncbi:hypothetical protein V6N13_029344 [Hibiscus sabdariffa]|uniref:Uncharacterized protein n=2 Tax=Hibiscus sabdariffa TaxID=183260 RepID=A0ABR2TA73_9ROSI